MAMDSVVGMAEDCMAFFDDLDQVSSSEGYKLVPWMSWDEWDSVRESLFSSSADEVAFALERISTWRSRGPLPAAVDVTASIIEIQQKDGFISREKQPIDALYSEHLLQMLYCMAILRLVNCVIEKTRRRTEVSIAEAAKAIGMPRKLIDLRHEGSHRELPSLPVLRNAADEAIEWLKSYYWEPQKQQIPFKKDGTASIRREIKSKLRKLAFCLQLRENPQLGSLFVKEKCSKKRVAKIRDALVEIYSSFSSEVVSALLEFMLKALDSSSCVEPNVRQEVEGMLDEWRPVIVELSNKEPELLLSLLEAVLAMIGNKEFVRHETGDMPSESKKASRAEHHSLLFAWLVGCLKGLKHMPTNISLGTNANLMELLRKCLLLAASSNNQLMDSALQLSELMGGHAWKQKLKNLASLHLSTMDVSQNEFPESVRAQEESIHVAAKKLEIIKLQLSKNKSKDSKGTDAKKAARWLKAETWNPCPIGMLPRALGSSGRLPVLDSTNTSQNTELDLSKEERTFKLRRCISKRGGDCDTELLKNSSAKRMKEMVETCETNSKFASTLKDASRDIPMADDSRTKLSDSMDNFNSECEDFSRMDGGRGCLMINGVWKKIGKEELLAIESSIRILV